MNDQEKFAKPEYFPLQFWKVFSTSLGIYKNSFKNYLFLAALTYLPFLIINSLSPLDLLDLIDFFHGIFLDIMVFLTLPTIYINRRVYPIATIVLFQRFFASAVIISFIQLGVLWLFIGVFVGISVGLIIFGVIPFVFLIFAGFFLILENKNSLISVGENLLKSFKVVRANFLLVFWNFLNITFLITVPVLFFSIYYLSQHPDWVSFFEKYNPNVKAEPVFVEELFKLVQNIVQELGYKIGRIGIHIFFRPLKSIFLSLLFLGIMVRIAPVAVQSFLGAGKDGEKESNDPLTKVQTDEKE
ncbi:MAG: hypothetical protein OEY59_03635 [Deltaproteobacteria bacterium]|nr:hypothetical protein [Deltaproteobacteria bacterium]